MVKSVKDFLKKALKRIGLCRKFHHLFKRVDIIDARLERLEGFLRNSVMKLEQMIQVEIMNQYKTMWSLIPPPLVDTGFKAYSQFEEDGILLYIFSLIGFTNRKVVEICCGTGDECNTANLIINHACYGLLLDGNEYNVKVATDFFKSNNMTWLLPPICKHAWITKDNINSLIEEEGFKGDIDLLSLDIDGIDYYLWDSLEIISPRVFICECLNIAPDDMAITIPYKENFSRANDRDDFFSVSPLAMIKLSKKKGYRLIGSHKYGFNLIFMRNDIGTKYFPEVSLEKITDNQYTKTSKETRWPLVKDAPWVKV